MLTGGVVRRGRKVGVSLVNQELVYTYNFLHYACMRFSVLMQGAFSRLVIMLPVVFILACAPDEPGRDWREAEFSEIESAARGSTVRIHMWGGSATINSWVDGPFSDFLRSEYDIELERIAMDAPVFVNRLITERQAGRAEGSMDLLWINGENFRNAREGDVLYGPFLELVPNFTMYGDRELAETDFGFPVDGYEVPWGKGQFVFEYDSGVTEPPRSFEELPRWLRENPGRFTYPRPPDFTGSAFLRQAFVALTGGWEQYMNGFDEELYEQSAPELFAYLRDIEPYLWEGGETYPSDLAALDNLFEDGEVSLSMSYDVVRAQSYIEQGRYPASVRTHVMAEGSVAGVHNLAIAFNSPNVPGALVAIHAALDPRMQLSKLEPANWGDFSVLDLNSLDEDMRKRFDDVDLGEATLPIEELDRAAMPELSAAYLERIEADWERIILRREQDVE